MDLVNELRVVRDISKLRAINPGKFSEALSLIIIDDFDAYLAVTDSLFVYDEATGGEKNSKGYQPISDKVDLELRKSLISFVSGV